MSKTERLVCGLFAMFVAGFAISFGSTWRFDMPSYFLGAAFAVFVVGASK